MEVVGESTAEVLARAKKLILDKGELVKGQRGQTRSLKCVDLVLVNPFDDPEPCPFWSRKETEWYLEFFVEKREANRPERLASPGEHLAPYVYAHRSRYYDLGFGYTLGLVSALNKLKIDPACLTKIEDLTRLLIEVGQLVHLQRILSVMSWWGRGLLGYWLNRPQVLTAILNRTRRDTLMDVIGQIRNSPNTRRALTPSFIYPNIDLMLPAGGIPPYQNYQLFLDGKGLISVHLHRAIDVRGGAQLDFAHDIAWGREASESLGQPLTQIIIRVNDLYLPLTGPVAKTREIQEWLMIQTSGYQANKAGVEKELSQPEYERSVKMTWETWQT